MNVKRVEIEGGYWVSSIGEVGKGTKVLKPTPYPPKCGKSTGSMRVWVGHKLLTVHTAVAKNFVPNPYNLKRVGFKDGDWTNCSADNLEYLGAKPGGFEPVDIWPIVVAEYQYLIGIARKELAGWSRIADRNELAKDAVHSAFEIADRKFTSGAVDPSGSARSYVGGIVINQAKKLAAAQSMERPLFTANDGEEEYCVIDRAIPGYCSDLYGRKWGAADDPDDCEGTEWWDIPGVGHG